MKISVIIPTYNREDYLCKAIDSLLVQTFPDFEIIVIDDGSTDNTKQIVKQYSNKIRYAYINNCGAANARNVGMKMAQGEYIAWLDSDDLYYPHKLELQLSILEARQDIDFVYTEFTAFNEKGTLGEKYLKSYHSAAYSKGLAYDNIFNKHCKATELNIKIAKKKEPNYLLWKYL